MPRIPDQIADCSIYFYEHETDAIEGSEFGGCGFLVHFLSDVNPNVGFLYAVTNKHVVENFGVIRLSRKGGGFDTISTKHDDWFTHPGGDDIAVLPLDITDETLARFKWWSVPSSHFITHEVRSRDFRGK